MFGNDECLPGSSFRSLNPIIDKQFAVFFDMTLNTRQFPANPYYEYNYTSLPGAAHGKNLVIKGVPKGLIKDSDLTHFSEIHTKSTK
jgi:hypothetical protein